MTALRLTREQILGFRRRIGGLDERTLWGSESLRRAAWSGLQDSMPRAALLSLHARVSGTPVDALEHPSLAQVWGPRFGVFVVAEEDAPIFTLGRMPDGGPRATRARETIERLEALLGDARMTYGEAGRALGVDPNSLRYGTLTGRIRLSWDGARQPTIWIVPAPAIEPDEARRELARRFLHVLGPATAEGLANWAGIKPVAARSVLGELENELIPVETPLGSSWALAADEEVLRTPGGTPAPARLLPSGDAFFLMWGADRSLLVPDRAHQDLLWTSRVWPGAVLVAGEVAGIWRRAKTSVTIEPWRRLSAPERAAVEAEALSFPLPDEGRISVVWSA